MHVRGMLSSTQAMFDGPSHSDLEKSITRKRRHYGTSQIVHGTKSPRRWPRRMTRICSISLSTPWSDRRIEPGAWNREVASLSDTSPVQIRHFDQSQDEGKETDDERGKAGKNTTFT